VRKIASWTVVVFAAISAATAQEAPADTTADGYCIYSGGESEEQDEKTFGLAVPAPPWLGPSGAYVPSRAAAGLACSYSRLRFEVRADARYYFRRGDYDVYKYSVGGAFRLFILNSRQRPFVEIKSKYAYRKYYVGDPRRRVTGSYSDLYPGVLFGVAYNYDGRGSNFAGAGGYMAAVGLSSGYVYNYYPFVLENITFVNNWLGFWGRGEFLIPYFAIHRDLSGGVAFAF
jgi:hypothetical protein